MKKLLYILTFLMPLTVALPQSYYPVLGKQHTQWNTLVISGSNLLTISNICEGDTVLGWKTYKKCLLNLLLITNQKDSLFYYLREDTLEKKLWILRNDSANEMLTFDFSLNKGNTVILSAFKVDIDSNMQMIFIDTTYTFIVDSIYNSTTLSGIRKTFKLAPPLIIPGSFSTDVIAIEGVGIIQTTCGPIILPPTTSLSLSYLIRNSGLICYFKDSIQQYMYSGVTGKDTCSYNEWESIQEHNMLLTNFSLYPIPLSDLLYLSYDLKNSGRVTISVFNILQQKVITLLDEKQQPSHYKHQFNTKLWNLNPGLYIISMEVDKQRVNKKIVKF